MSNVPPENTPPDAQAQPRQMQIFIDPVPPQIAAQMVAAGLDPDMHCRVTTPVLGFQALDSSHADRGLDLMAQAHLPSAVLPIVSRVVDPKTGRFRVVNAVAGLSVVWDVQRVYLTEPAIRTLAIGDQRKATDIAAWEICRRLWRAGGFDGADLKLFDGLGIDDETARRLIEVWEKDDPPPEVEAPAEVEAEAANTSFEDLEDA